MTTKRTVVSMLMIGVLIGVATMLMGCASKGKLEVRPGTPKVLIKTTTTTTAEGKTTTTTTEYTATSSGAKHEENMATIDKDKVVGVAKQNRVQNVSSCGFFLGCAAVLPVNDYYGGAYGNYGYGATYGNYNSFVTPYNVFVPGYGREAIIVRPSAGALPAKAVGRTSNGRTVGTAVPRGQSAGPQSSNRPNENGSYGGNVQPSGRVGNQNSSYGGNVGSAGRPANETGAYSGNVGQSGRPAAEGANSGGSVGVYKNPRP